jgi:hypothetical protein
MAFPLGGAARGESAVSGAPDDLSPFGAPTLEQLTALVFELASQLHVERVHRIALEAALEDAGVLAAGAAERVADLPGVRERAAAGLDRSLAGVMRVLTEDVDPRRPLRAQSRRTSDTSGGGAN